MNKADKNKINQIKEDIVSNIYPNIQEYSKSIKLILNEIQETKSKQDKIYEKSLEDSTNIETYLDDSKQEAEKIQNFYNEIFLQTEEEPSISSEIRKFHQNSLSISKELEDKKDKITLLCNEVENLNKEVIECSKAYEEELKKMKSLLPAAATVGLSAVYVEKVKQYKYEGWFWTGLNIIALFILVVIYWNNPVQITTISDLLINILAKSPFITFTVWLLIFLGNRRAECKKLEESYKHKESLSRSYIGYKDQIDSIKDEDQKLILKHMDNILKALSKDSSEFLSHKGENHLIKNLLSENKSV